MPSLRLFGQRTMFAGDDLRSMAKLHAIYRLCQLVLALIFLGKLLHALDDELVEDAVETCSGTGRFEKLTENGVMILFLYSSLAVFLSLISITVLGPMHYFSGKGTPTDATLRRPLFPLCYVDILLVNFFRVGVFVVGAMSLYVVRQYCICFAEGENGDEMKEQIRDICPQEAVFMSILIAIVITHGIDTLMVVLTFLYFTVTFATPQRSLLSSERRCKICFRCCIACTSLSTCCLFGGAEAVRGDLGDFALLMSNYLNNDRILDITASDVHIGLHMLYRLQKQASLETKGKLMKEAMAQEASRRRINAERQATLDDVVGMDLVQATLDDVVGMDLVAAPVADTKGENMEAEERCVHPDVVLEASEKGSSSSLLHSKSPGGLGGDGMTKLRGLTTRNDSKKLSTSSLSHGDPRGGGGGDGVGDEGMNNHEPLTRRYDSQNTTTTTSRRTRRRGEALSANNSRDVYLMGEAAHFAPLAQASYTWVSYMLEYPISGMISLSYRILRRCACIYRSSKGTINYDYPWHPHTEALLTISGLEEKDVIYATYQESLTSIPYMILLDHSWRSVVVAIRGTLTLESVLTDVSVKPEELTKLGDICGFDGTGKYCHAGMLASTEWVYNDLQKHRKLAATLNEYKDYRLRVIGHSLGAGVASILALLLQPTYKRLRCLAYSPPGCVLSENLANESKKFTNSYVIGADIVPRMSIEGFELLRDGVLEMIYRVKVPKYKVTTRNKEYDDSTLEGVTKSIEETLYDKDDNHDSEFERQVLQFWRFQTELKEKNRSTYIHLCPPGSIIHLFPTDDEQGWGIMNGNLPIPSLLKGSSDDAGADTDTDIGYSTRLGKYTARWVKRSDLRKIIISSRLLLDHDPIGVKHKIQQVAREQFGLENPFLPDDLEWKEP